MDLPAPTPAIACTLAADDYAQRLAWIAALTRESLLSASRTGLTLELHYAAEAREALRRLVAHESECCAFLRFQLDEPSDGAVRLVIIAPDAAADAANELFAQFTGAAATGP